MAKTNNPFFNFDMSKMMVDFDPAKMVDEYTRLVSQYQVPGIDMNAVVESQRRNLDALTQANRVALEGIQAVTRRQAEILQETMNEVSATVESMAGAETPQDVTAKQAELLKTAFEKALANMKELAELVAKSNAEATDAINRRISESLEEIKKAAADVKKKK